MDRPAVTRPANQSRNSLGIALREGGGDDTSELGHKASKWVSPLSSAAAAALRTHVYQKLRCQSVSLQSDNIYTAIALLHVKLKKTRMDLHALRMHLPLTMSSEQALLSQLQGVLGSTRDRSKAIEREYASMMLGDVDAAEWRRYEQEMQAMEQDIEDVEREMRMSQIGFVDASQPGVAANDTAAAAPDPEEKDTRVVSFLTDIPEADGPASPGAKGATQTLSHIANFPAQSAITRLHGGLHDRFTRVSTLRARYKLHNDALREKIREANALLQEKTAELPKLAAEVHQLEQTLGQLYEQTSELKSGIQKSLLQVGNLLDMWENERAMTKAARNSSSGKMSARTRKLDESSAMSSPKGDVDPARTGTAADNSVFESAPSRAISAPTSPMGGYNASVDMAAQLEAEGGDLYDAPQAREEMILPSENSKDKGTGKTVLNGRRAGSTSTNQSASRVRAKSITDSKLGRVPDKIVVAPLGIVSSLQTPKN